MSDLKPETRDKLMHVSVATLATALFKRGLRNQTIQDVHPVKASSGSGARNMLWAVPISVRVSGMLRTRSHSRPWRSRLPRIPMSVR